MAQQTLTELGTGPTTIADNFDKANSNFDELYTEAEKESVVELTDLRQAAARKDALPDSANGTTLGLGDSQTAVVTGTAASNSSVSETAAFRFALPEEYEDGAAITLRVRAREGVGAAEVDSTIDAVVKAFADGAVGSDICATDPQSLTTSYANYDFTITPTGLTAGTVLDVVLTAASNDTGGSTGTTVQISKVSILPVTRR